MRVVGVVDLRGGRAVHARAGRREQYLPVAEAAGMAIDGDAVALARAYVGTMGVRELYVADLDAIEHGVGASQSAILAEIATVGVPVWADSGTSTLDEARLVLGGGASIVVVGLETLPDFDALGEICRGVGGSRVAFSVDLRDGVPITRPNVGHAKATPVEIATSAARAGARHIIVLDLARVGTGTGVTVETIVAIRRVVPDVVLLAGGGVRDASDLADLGGAGCDGALVATALLTGALLV